VAAVPGAKAAPSLPFWRAELSVRKAVTAAPAPPPPASVLPEAVTLQGNVQPRDSGRVQHYTADSDAAVRGDSQVQGVKQEPGQAENGSDGVLTGGPTGAAEPWVAGVEHVQQILNKQAAPQLGSPPPAGLAAQAQALMLVQPAASVPRSDSLEAVQQAAAAPDMAAGGGVEASGAGQAPPAAGDMVQLQTMQQGCSNDEGSTTTDEEDEEEVESEASSDQGEEEQGQAGEMVPTWAIPKHEFLEAAWAIARRELLLVPMPRRVGRHIKSVRLELGGVLLPAECSQSLRLQYRPQQQVLVVSGSLSYVHLLVGPTQRRARHALLDSATLLPSQLQGGGEGGAEPSCLVIRASWPLAPPGRPVSVTSAVGSKDLHAYSLCEDVPMTGEQFS
jgi:hypothetical protein